MPCGAHVNFDCEGVFNYSYVQPVPETILKVTYRLMLMVHVLGRNL